jgi:hypothetical protein
MVGFMKKSAIWHLAILVVAATWASLWGAAELAQSQEISDLYSSIESADVSLRGDPENVTIKLDLIHEGQTIASSKIDAEVPGTWVVSWPALDFEKGSYEVRSSLWKDNAAIAEKNYNFYYGGVEPIRFDVRDFRADSRGIHMAISASDPTVVDIYYMLVDGNRAVYITREEVVPIAGSYSSPIIKDYDWKQILENGHKYSGRVKIVELNHNQTRAFMNSFQAVDDAIITETYEDETGASATVLGNSRVPFKGSLRFILTQNGSVLNTTEKATPVLLSGDDETVEITWNKTLEPGIYQLRTVLIGQGNDVKDLEENVIEAEPMIRTNATGSTNSAEKSSFPAGLTAVALLIIAHLKRRR